MSILNHDITPQNLKSDGFLSCGWANEPEETNTTDELSEKDIMLIEIGVVGKIGKLKVYVWPQYGGDTPVFLIGDAETFPFCTQFSTAIKIESAEYFSYGGKYTDKLNSEQCEELMELLNTIEEDDGIKNWDFLRSTWNRGNSKHVPFPQSIPNYTKLK